MINQNCEKDEDYDAVINYQSVIDSKLMPKPTPITKKKATPVIKNNNFLDDLITKRDNARSKITEFKNELDVTFNEA